ncbi:5'-3' exoribonuclease-like isoform X1 [Phoenix dactylifera]|uniref:5'-3' exoribonuclease-like isoform X1 n=1 Tax=Phoenix dactylifera TaxID=42345 RepID=A0A8B8JAD2_PHODC|nr:5'-3' exoribonuclease-like isoform X1 [Phoenix dactylifera]
MGDPKKKKRRAKSKKKAAGEQSLLSRYIRDWVFRDPPPTATDDFAPPPVAAHRAADRVVFELHSHSKYSDGFLSPSALVERAHRNGVKVLALTDHDTMAGIPEAMETAHKFGMRIIPGVEISSVFSPREEPGTGEPVHILAYYGSCGPAKYEELDELLSSIRNGRYVRAKNMLLKLNKLKIPLKWDHVAKIAGNGVAPGRLHVARAMVEAGYVENLRQAFNRYLYDGGPAYAMGSEPFAETVVQLICRTGGVAALAHPWALKNPIPVIRGLKSAGLHAIEIYRSDGKVAGFSELAETYTLLKLGGSDYHGRGGHDESGLGSVDLPLISVYGFLKMARPIWCNAVKDILLSYADEPSAANLEKITRFRKLNNLKGYSTPSCGKDVIDQCLSSWLTNDEKEGDEFEAIRMKLAHIDISNEGSQKPIVKG